jgi:hypothetical protein
MHKSYRPFLLTALFLATVQVGFFSATMIWPIPNETGLPMSPLVRSGTDLHYYSIVGVRWAKTGILAAGDLYLQFYQNLRIPDISAVGVHAAMSEIRMQVAVLGLDYYSLGPAFPALLILWDYGPGNTLPLAIFFLFLGISGGIVWIFWLRASGMPTIWILLFCLLPGPLYFTISLGTDLPFLFAMGLFFCAYSGDRWKPANFIVWFSAICLMAMMRPTALSILAFVVVDLCLQRNPPMAIGIRSTVGAAFLGLFLLTFAYYFPHGVHVIGGTSQLPYFGITVGEFYGGLYPGLPDWLDKGVSLLLLMGAKILYFVGIRPSFGDTETWLVLIRAAPGLLLLPGLVWGLFFSGWRVRLFLVLFMLPNVVGPAQDRYSLPIQPLLIFYCACAYSRAMAIVFHSVISPSKMRSAIFTNWVEPSLVKPNARLL